MLTSVSVSRECGLVNPIARIYMPRFVSGSPIDPESVIAWDSVDGGSSQVDPVTYREILIPSEREGDGVPSSVRLASNEYYLAITGDVLSWMLDFASEECLQKVIII